MTQSIAVSDLGNRNPESFRRIVASGIDHLAANIRRLDAAAQRASRDGDESIAPLLGSFADEEAAKVLILIDAVRCPQSCPSDRASTLKRWRDHKWKGIYVRACEWRPVDLPELAGYIEQEMQPFYLDGPLDVDWIFQNEIKSERERNIYVDLVQDLTESEQSGQDPYWVTPQDFNSSIGGYRRSNCVEVALSLRAQGITTERGLARVATIWQPIDPEAMHVSDLFAKINETLSAVRQDLKALAVQEEDRPSPDPLANWPFPLWSIPEPEVDKPREALKTLRAERQAELERIRHLQSMKEPPPSISRAKVIEMDAAHAKVQKAWRKRIAAHPSNGGGLRIISADLDLDVTETPAGKHLSELWWGLSDAERVSLVALAWFTRDVVANWPRALKLAQQKPDIHSTQMEHYCLNLGSAWLKGMDRWETPADQMPTRWG